MTNLKLREFIKELEKTWYPARLLTYTVKTREDSFVSGLIDHVVSKCPKDDRYKGYLDIILNALDPNRVIELPRSNNAVPRKITAGNLQLELNAFKHIQ